MITQCEKSSKVLLAGLPHADAGAHCTSQLPPDGHPGASRARCRVPAADMGCPRRRRRRRTTPRRGRPCPGPAGSPRRRHRLPGPWRARSPWPRDRPTQESASPTPSPPARPPSWPARTARSPTLSGARTPDALVDPGPMLREPERPPHDPDEACGLERIVRWPRATERTSIVGCRCSVW